MTETAYAKVNLALHVRGRLPDGYHQIETLFAFCEAGDLVSAEHAPTQSLKISGEFAGGLGRADNLVEKAANVLREACGGGEPAALHLQKLLPIAAGLGGGSADAAATLRVLSRLWNLPTPIERLEEIAKPHEIEATVSGQPVWTLEYFCTDPRPQKFEVNFHLPDSIGAGAHPLEISLGRRKLAPVMLEVVA